MQIRERNIYPKRGNVGSSLASFLIFNNFLQREFAKKTLTFTFQVLLFSFEEREQLEALHVLFTIADLRLCPHQDDVFVLCFVKDGTAATCAVSRQKGNCQTAQYKSIEV